MQGVLFSLIPSLIKHSLSVRVLFNMRDDNSGAPFHSGNVHWGGKKSHETKLAGTKWGGLAPGDPGCVPVPACCWSAFLFFLNWSLFIGCADCGARNTGHRRKSDTGSKERLRFDGKTPDQVSTLTGGEKRNSVIYVLPFTWAKSPPPSQLLLLPLTPRDQSVIQKSHLGVNHK